MEDIEAGCAYGFTWASRVYFLQLPPSSSIVENSENDLLFHFILFFWGGALIYLIIRTAGAEQTGPSWLLDPSSGLVQKRKLWTMIPKENSYLLLGSNIRRMSTLSVLIILCCGLSVSLIVFTKGGGIHHLPTMHTSSV